ncbi:ATP-binding protein [Floccifex sp.]|uniref:ATP-binding protein n=1 Tax=Floccifex sp. TaxID=2815810 RepID=UPI002A75193A|nr:ATP-binding protein [Floccifex sp.]MDD7281063.1 ATP-binding protein [Erysipelotrichaceae bacterium]MDY2957353.1 ATP-binding protein [Floccifex sp.]
MKIIQRNYLQKMINVLGTPDIKVITGIRRSGKSFLLMQFMEYLKQNDANANIIFIDFNSLDSEPYLEYHALNNYINNCYNPTKNNYVCIDEVQMCEGFEKVINSLHNSRKYDIYITGSNAFLLSSDLATLFTGRTYEIEIFPFSYSECVEYYGNEYTLEKYVLEGGMPGSFVYRERNEKYKYIRDIFETLIIRDITSKHAMRNKEILRDLAYFMMDNVSALTSASSISKTIEKANFNISDKTIKLYMKYFTDAFLFYRVRRYDIKGKKYLFTNDKYYLTDHSFRYANIGTRNMDYGRIYENIVAIELLRRGYEIYVGKLYKKEVDFVAMKQSEKIYIQVSDDITNEKTFEREVSSLLQIKDNYPKILLANTHHEQYQYEGIQIIDIERWLLTN